MRYPFSCPRCKSVAGMDLTDSDTEDHEYTEFWQCDECGCKWTVEFELSAVTVQPEEEQ